MRENVPPLLTEEDVSEVLDEMVPVIRAHMVRHAKRQEMAIRVLNPMCADEPVLMGSRDIGAPETWETPYGEVAFGKARLAHRCRMDTEIVIREAPFLLRPGDPPYPGGIYLFGLVVGCSGVEAYNDTLYARWIAEALRNRAIHRFKTEVEAPGLRAVPAAA